MRERLAFMAFVVLLAWSAGTFNSRSGHLTGGDVMIRDYRLFYLAVLK